MPIKNADSYLEKCLESVVNQSHEDWELIAINDHSTDKSVEILQHFSEKDERIIVHHNKGNGIIDALTLGEAKSSGKWISRMDADDIMKEDKLSKLLNALDSENQISTSYVRYFSDGELGDGYKRYEAWLNQLIDNNNHYSEIYKECVIPSPNWLMHKNLLNKLGGFKSLSYPEDYDLCFRAYEEKVKIKGVKEVLHHWRDYPNRTSRTDDNYKDNAFLPLKVKNFLNIDYDPLKRLVLWGAGKKGKKLAAILIDNQIDFDWITNNTNKLSAPIFGKELIHVNQLESSPIQSIIAVAGPEDQKEIKTTLRASSNIQAYWFC